MSGHDIQTCEKHSLCRWIRHCGSAFPGTSMSARRQAEYERAQDPQAWIVGVMPLIAFGNLIWDDGNRAIIKSKAEEPRLSSYVETNQRDVLHRMTALRKFLKRKDPQGRSRAHRRLLESDPGLKKLKMVGYVFKDPEIKPLKEWNDLGHHLDYWVRANAIPRLNMVPTTIAVEAADVYLNTNYYDCWCLLNRNGKLLEDIEAVRYRDPPASTRNAFEM
ncbi:hypothetical protein FLONG3_4161 [Fusarium longipes]|uniref:Uncharacterized protein n=1 Tax=Fusarium longipes TaxID=694270 RepID=A0A395T065_9HYPO|nr:hypothetical protein FLONG3_4161 [Fusarium longipes]